MSKYISLTLGPITRTINLAESTKELWAASYFFSYLAKKITEPFANKKHEDYRERKFLLPYMDNDTIWEPHDGAGLFPDRYIFISRDDDFIFLKMHIDNVLKELSGNICNSLKKTDEEQDILEFLKTYLKIYFFEKSFENDSIPEIVKECERYMNLIEMQDSFPAKEKLNYLYEFFKNINGDPVWEDNVKKDLIEGFKGTFLTKDAYGENRNERLFESVIEISAAELSQNIYEEYIAAVYKAEPEEKNDKKPPFDAQEILLLKELKPYHKYIAIVKADGDNIGKFKEVLADDESKLSMAFLEYNIKVVDIINQYKGRAVFVGGDDLLFFAPVYFNNENIFQIIAKIDNCFKESFAKLVTEKDKKVEEIQLPTLSYGISITYFKYPMFEALETAGYLLDESAKCMKEKNMLADLGVGKDFIEKYIKKNNISFSLQKHSGQIISSFLRKGCEESYSGFLSLIKDYTKSKDLTNNNEKKKEEGQFLSSVMHKLHDYEPMLEIILKQKEKDASVTMLKYFFENNFNETVHEKYKNLLNDIQKLILSSYKENEKAFGELNKEIINMDIPGHKKEELFVNPVKESIDIAYTALRFIHFINSESDE